MQELPAVIRALAFKKDILPSIELLLWPLEMDQQFFPANQVFQDLAFYVS